MLCCSYQAERQAVVVQARSRAPLWKALINPDLSRALTRGGKARQEGAREWGVGGSLPLKMLRLIKSSH